MAVKRDGAGRFTKGSSKPEGSGMKKGFVYPFSKRQRTDMEEWIVANFPEFVKRMASLDDAEFVKQYLAVLRFLLPTPQSITFEGEGQATITIEDRLRAAATKMTKKE